MLYYKRKHKISAIISAFKAPKITEGFSMKNKPHIHHKKHRHIPAPHNKNFTAEEARRLENEFIEAYSGNAKSSFRILFSMFKQYPWKLLLSVFFHYLALLPHVLSPIFTANLINVAVEAYKTGNTDVTKPLLINAGALLFFILLNIPTNIIRTKYRSQIMRQVEVGIRAALVRKLQQLSIPFHKEMQSGRIQSKLMRDIDAIHVLLYNLTDTIPQVIFHLVIALCVVVTKSLTIFSFFLLCIPVAVLTMQVFRKPIKERNKQYRIGMEETSSNLADMVEMTQITRAHALEDREVTKMTGILNRVAKNAHQLDKLNALFGACSYVVFQGFSLLCLVFSVTLAVKGSIEIGDISMYQSYFVTLIGQVSTIINLMPNITKGFDSLSSIGEILSANDIEDNEGKKKLQNFRGEYEFKNVHFAYEDNQPLLTGLDLHVKAGETIAIVGESGSGKSTILNLVLGFNTPVSGSLKIDGEEIENIDLHSYRTHLAVVPQNSILFMGTIRENITYGLDNVSEEKLWEIIEAAKLTEFIKSLPDGLDTSLKEHAGNLSGGQKQRISIARALMRDPDVIIFDEATSALDSVSEKQIQAAINNLSKGRTTFIVAHRLSTIKEADRIAVIKDGVCCEIGTFDELCAKHGEFYKMETLQQI